ncbi:hypothetical protein Tco_0562173 [Tanacetum coccineum]
MISYTCLRTVSTSENDSSYKYLYEFDESHEALHIFRDIFQKSSEHSDLNFRCVLNKFHKHIECFSNHVFANRSSTRTASIRKSDTSVLEDLKALSWKTCQEGSLLNLSDHSKYEHVGPKFSEWRIEEKITSNLRKSEIKMKLSNLVIQVSKIEFLQKHKYDRGANTSRFDHETRVPGLGGLGGRYGDVSDKPIRLQGKNGVLKVMVKKHKPISVPYQSYERVEDVRRRD